jgi:hypothetical protein
MCIDWHPPLDKLNFFRLEKRLLLFFLHLSLFFLLAFLLVLLFLRRRLLLVLSCNHMRMYTK